MTTLAPQSADDPRLGAVLDLSGAGRAVAEPPPAALDVSSGLPSLRAAHDRYVEERLLRVDVETRDAERLSAERRTGGFWDELVAEPLAEIGQVFEDAFDPAPEDTAAQKGELTAMLHGMFAADPVLSGLTANLDYPDVRAADRLLAAPSSTPFPVERFGGPLTKSDSSPETCARSIVTASIGAVAKTGIAAAGNVVRAVQAVGMTVGFVKRTVADLGPALMNLPAQDLLGVVAGQGALCAQAEKIARLLLKLLRSTDGAFLTVSAGADLYEVKALLQSADAALAREEALLFVGAPFDRGLWDSARRDVAAAADLLCDPTVKLDVDFFALAPPVLAETLIAALDATLRLLARQQALRLELELALAGFEIGFAQATRFDSLFGPAVELVRCRIGLICEEIAASGSESFFRTLARQKRWCLELRAVEAFMRFSAKLDLPDKLEKFTGTAALRKAADAVLEFVDEQRRKLADRDISRALALGFAFVTHARRSVQLRTYLPQAVALGDAFVVEIGKCATSGAPFVAALAAFGATVVEAAPEAVKAVDRILRFSEERGLTGFVSSAKAGRVEDAFKIDGLTASTEGALAAASARTAASVPVDKPVAAAKAARLAAAHADQARAVGLYDALWNDAYSRHVDVRLNVDRTGYEAERRRIAEIAAELSGGYAAPTPAVLRPAAR